MKTHVIFLIAFLQIFSTAFGQKEPKINITFSKLLATYDFLNKLSDNYPDNECKKVFKSSKFHTRTYTDLVKQFDTLNIYESYSFQGYPTGQKTPVMTTALIERNLINATSIEQFKIQSFGIVPNSELFVFSQILSAFEPIYDSLIYFPNKTEFEKQLLELKEFVQKSDLSDYFEKGLVFYSSQWDNSIPLNIAVIPSVSKNGFTAKAFLNNAVSEIPLSFKENDVLFSVLMHEIYHNIYDGQSLEHKLKIQSWFKNNTSKNSQYAYLLLNEALATAFGNGYVYEQLNGKTDNSEWYNIKYINLMAKRIYPLVKEYINQQKTIDSNFINKYIALYDSNWINELDNLFTNRYMIADNPNDFTFVHTHYRHSSCDISEFPISQSSIERMKETPITKLIIISSDSKNKLNLLKATFPELKDWKCNAEKEFTYTVNLLDKTKLIIVNKHSSTLEELFEKNFKDKKTE